MRAFATLWEHGGDIDLDDLLGEERPPRCALPGYPFDSRDPDARDTGRPAVAAVDVAQPAPADRDPLRSVLERLWCTALGVPSVAEDDHFYALGGESLMAVTLVNRVREHTGSRLTVAQFTGSMWLSAGTLALIGAGLIAVWLLLAFVSAAVFERESILTRWR